jgi:pimeloyl-ACP methyl ester carboxylesterase
MNKPPLVLIHGMWCTPAVWGEFARRFEAMGFEAHAPALPKPSDPGTLGRISVRDCTRSVSAWIANKKFRTPPIVVGHSLGGLVAQQLAQTHVFSALILLAPVPPRGINLIYPAGLRTTISILTSPKFWKRPTRLGWSATRWGLFNEVPEARARELYEHLVPGSGTVYREIAFWFLSKDRPTGVATEKVQTPVFIAGGNLDHIIPVSVVRKIAKLYSGSEFIAYPNSGHWLIEEPITDQLVKTLHAWLGKVVPALPKVPAS